MKKMYKYILIITLMMFGFMGEVRAENIKEKICTYETEDDKVIEIVYEKYYTLSNNGSENHYKTELTVFVDDKEKDKVKFSLNGVISTVSDKDEIKQCPANVYKLDSWGTNNYCFDDDGACPDVNSKYEKISLKKEPENKFYEDYIKKLGLGSLEVSDMPIIDECIENDTCMPLCLYKGTYNGHEHSALIYYYPNQTIYNRYKVAATWVGNGELNNLATTNVVSAKAHIIAADLSSLITEGVCPKNVYMDNDDLKKSCFDNNGRCITELSNIEEKEHINASVETTSEINEYLISVKKDRKTELSCETAKSKIESQFSLNEVTEICGYTRTDSPNDETRQFFVLANKNEFKFYQYIGNKFKEVTNTREKDNVTFNDSYTCTAFDAFYVTNDDVEDSKWRAGEVWYQRDLMYLNTCSLGEPMGYDKIDNNITDCKSLLGDDLRNEINSWFLYIKIAVPIILIVMGSLDFGKAFISSDEDAMKKAQKKFIMRIIIALVIFFIPALVNILLNVADQVWNISNGNGTCQIQF